MAVIRELRRQARQIIASLLGIGVIAILVGLQTATTASVTDASHARSFAVLHDASDAVYDAPRLSCEVGETALIAAYSADLATEIDS